MKNVPKVICFILVAWSCVFVRGCLAWHPSAEVYASYFVLSHPDRFLDGISVLDVGGRETMKVRGAFRR